MIRRYTVFVMTAFTFVLATCFRQPLQPEPSFDLQAVQDLTTSFIDSLETVELTWQNPNTNANGFRIYRTSDVDLNGNPINLTAIDRLVPGNAGKARNIVGLINGIYYYTVKAVAIIQNGTFFDTLEGPACPPVPCRVGPGLTFSINDGDVFITIDTCDLVIKDLDKVVQSVEFTDSSYTTILPTGTETKVVYGVKSPLSSTVSADGTERRYRWALSKGGGAKTVYAAITLTDNNKKVMTDDIKIQPYRIGIKFRNEIDPSKREMKILKEDSGEVIVTKKYDQYRIYKPWIDFSISIFNDSTFAPDFEYRLVFAQGTGSSAANLLVPPTSPGVLIFTPKEKDSLTGTGSQHDDMHVYRYSFSPDSAEMNPACASARHLTKFTDENGVSYGNPNVMKPRDYFDTLKFMKPEILVRCGIKEFCVKAVFKGRYFNDIREVMSSPRFDPSAACVSYVDFYAPIIWRYDWDMEHYRVHEDGYEVYSPFKIIVDRCIDLGGADVKSIDLVISEMPDTLVERWKIQINPKVSITHPVSMAEMLGWRHKIIPMPLSMENIISPLEWNVDLAGWSSGWYLFGYITEDEYGNRGMDPIHLPVSMKGAPVMTNPYHLKIYTQEKGL